jgi:hypothetical protein
MHCLLTVLPLGTFFSDHNPQTTFHQPGLEMFQQSCAAKWTQTSAVRHVQQQLHAGIGGIDPLPAGTG